MLSIAGTGSCLGSVLLPNPIVSADFLGGGAVMRCGDGSTCVSSCIGVGCSCLTPFLAGSAGVGLPCG